MIWQDAVMTTCSAVFLLGAPGAAFRAKQSTRVSYSLAIMAMAISKVSLGLYGAAGVDVVSFGIWTAGAWRGRR